MITKAEAIAVLDAGGWFSTDHHMRAYPVYNAADERVGEMRASSLDAMRAYYQKLHRPGVPPVLGSPFLHVSGGVAIRRYRLAQFGPPPAVERHKPAPSVDALATAEGSQT